MSAPTATQTQTHTMQQGPRAIPAVVATCGIPAQTGQNLAARIRPSGAPLRPPQQLGVCARLPRANNNNYTTMTPPTTSDIGPECAAADGRACVFGAVVA
jgi:hypothetical protein